MNSGRAVVLGGGIAGLLAARVLVDHFDRVILLDKDRLPSGSQNRKGTPQDAHFHGLLARGERALSRLFPKLASSLIEGGAIALDMGHDIAWYQSGNYKSRFRSDLIGLSQSRPFLEWHIRRLVLDLKNVECFTQHQAENLIATGDRRRITGVKIRHRNGGEEEFDATLIVDTTGRGSLSPKWLQQLGYGKPRESVIKPGVGYASRIYRRRSDDLKGAKMLVLYPSAPRETRGGVLAPIEEGRWLVSLGGFVGDHPPADERDFLDFAQSLPAPDIYDVIKQLEPLTDIVVYKFPSSVWRHYEDMAQFPGGYVIVGDALCSLNPQYGQGMTMSALQAEALHDCLSYERRISGDFGEFPHRFFRKAADLVANAWRLAAVADLRYPQVEGDRAPWTKFFAWYATKIHRAAAHDQKVHGEFLKVFNLIQPPTSLFRPRVLIGVLIGNLGRRT